MDETEKDHESEYAVVDFKCPFSPPFEMLCPIGALFDPKLENCWNDKDVSWESDLAVFVLNLHLLFWKYVKERIPKEVGGTLGQAEVRALNFVVSRDNMDGWTDAGPKGNEDFVIGVFHASDHFALIMKGKKGVKEKAGILISSAEVSEEFDNERKSLLPGSELMQSTIEQGDADVCDACVSLMLTELMGFDLGKKVLEDSANPTTIYLARLFFAYLYFEKYLICTLSEEETMVDYFLQKNLFPENNVLYDRKEEMGFYSIIRDIRGKVDLEILRLKNRQRRPTTMADAESAALSGYLAPRGKSIGQKSNTAKSSPKKKQDKKSLVSAKKTKPVTSPKKQGKVIHETAQKPKRVTRQRLTTRKQQNKRSLDNPISEHQKELTQKTGTFSTKPSDNLQSSPSGFSSGDSMPVDEVDSENEMDELETVEKPVAESIAQTATGTVLEPVGGNSVSEELPGWYPINMLGVTCDMTWQPPADGKSAPLPVIHDGLTLDNAQMFASDASVEGEPFQFGSMYFAVVKNEGMTVQPVKQLMSLLFCPVYPSQPYVCYRCKLQFWNPVLFDAHMRLNWDCQKGTLPNTLTGNVRIPRTLVPLYFVITRNIFQFLERAFAAMNVEDLPLNVLNPCQFPMPMPSGGRPIPDRRVQEEYKRELERIPYYKSFLDMHTKKVTRLLQISEGYPQTWIEDRFLQYPLFLTMPFLRSNCFPPTMMTPSKQSSKKKQAPHDIETDKKKRFIMAFATTGVVTEELLELVQE